jgi:uncharacterized protein
MPQIWRTCGFGLGLMVSLQSCMLSRYFLYHPTTTNLEGLAHGDWEVVDLPLEQEGSLKGVVRVPEDENAAWMIFFGGNAMGLDAAQYCLELLNVEGNLGMASFAYRGYDGSSGSPTQDHLLQDTELIWRYLAQRFSLSPQRLIVIGQSLGTAIATYLASTLTRDGQVPKKLLLLSPYTSMEQVFQDHARWLPMGWLVADPYPLESWIEHVQTDILLVHGEDDSVIGVSHSERLLRRIQPGRGALLRLADVSHNNIWSDASALRKMRAWLETSVSKD